MDFTEDPFKDYRYEDPANIEDPFADAVDSHRSAPRPTSVAGFETDDFFALPPRPLNGLAPPPARSGRVSAPPGHAPAPGPAQPLRDDAWAAWPADTPTDDAWAEPAWAKPAQADAWASKNTNSAPNDWKTDNWANKSENWATDWGTDHNKNLNETWPSNTLPNKKEKSPKPVKYAKSLVHTIGGIGRSKQNKEKKSKLGPSAESRSADPLPSEEQQWAWAAAESARLQAEAEARRRQEDAELQLALAISRQEK